MAWLGRRGSGVLRSAQAQRGVGCLINHNQSQRLVHSNDSSTWGSNPLITTLLRQPISRIKATLDSQEFNSFSWEPLLAALNSFSPDKARLVLEWRLEKMMKENERNRDCYSELIYLCGKVQNVPIAMRVFTSMEAHGIKPTSDVFNALIFACLSSGNIVTALSLFEVMENSEGYRPNADTYDAFISAYANLGNDKVMQAWYSAKKDAGFSADLQTYESLIVGCVKSKNFDVADRFFEEMILAGVMPSVTILQSTVVGLCELRSLGRVKEFLKFILDGGWEINERMAEKLVRLYYELGRVDEMEELLITLTKSNQVVGVLSWVHGALIRMYAMSDRLDDVEYSVGRMLKQGISFRCPDDVEKVICSYFRRAAYDRLELFLECIADSYKLTRSTYDLLISGYRRVGLSVKLDGVMNDMKLAGFL